MFGSRQVSEGLQYFYAALGLGVTAEMSTSSDVAQSAGRLVFLTRRPRQQLLGMPHALIQEATPYNIVPSRGFYLDRTIRPNQRTSRGDGLLSPRVSSPRASRSRQRQAAHSGIFMRPSSSIPINVPQVLGFPRETHIRPYLREAPHALSAAAKKRSSPPNRGFLPSSLVSLSSNPPPAAVRSHGTPHARGRGGAVWLLRLPGYLEAFSWARRSTDFWRKWKESFRSSR